MPISVDATVIENSELCESIEVLFVAKNDRAELLSFQLEDDILFDNGATYPKGKGYLLVPAAGGKPRLLRDDQEDAEGDGLVAIFDLARVQLSKEQLGLRKADVAEALETLSRGMQAAQEKDQIAQVVPTVDYRIDRNEVSHAFAAKALRGLYSIAAGEGDESHPGIYILKGKVDSRDTVEISCVPDKCLDYFRLNNANHPYLLKLLGTLHTLMQDKQAERDVEYGRVWITENKLITEMSRTEQGTAKRVYRNKSARELVHRALLMLSSAQIEITLPNGRTQATEKLIDATFRANITSHGVALTDAWGFVPEVAPLFEGELASYSGSYALLDVPPLNDINTGLPTMVADWLHQLRRQLYENKRQESTKIVRSFDSIFADVSPARELRSEKKKQIVKNLLEIMRALAENEAQKASKPMWIQAEIARDGGRGKGAGKWVSITVTAHKHATEIVIPEVK